MVEEEEEAAEAAAAVSAELAVEWEGKVCDRPRADGTEEAAPNGMRCRALETEDEGSGGGRVKEES